MIEYLNMRIFEFHFNPKPREDLIYDSFCFEPKNVLEKKFGHLFLAGTLKNVLPQNSKFLDNLSKVLKERYYKFQSNSPNQALKESLKEANKFLDSILKKGNVSWLGNLSCAVLSVKNHDLEFTKTGDVKFLLLRSGEIIDIEKNLKFPDIEPYPLSVFNNVVEGKLMENDLLLVLTKDIFDFFQNKNLLAQIARVPIFDEKKIKNIFDKNQEELFKTSGVALFLLLNKSEEAPLHLHLRPVSQGSAKQFSPLKVFAPILKYFKKIISRIKINFKINFPVLNKKIILAGFLVLFLTIGFFVARLEEKQKLKKYEASLSDIQEKFIKAGANSSLLEESWRNVSLLSKISNNAPKTFKEKISLLQKEISLKLFDLNKLIKIENPELFFEINQKDFLPQKIVQKDKNIYLFTPYGQGIFKINSNKTTQTILPDKKFSSAEKQDNAIIFLAKPNQLVILKNDETLEVSLKTPPYLDFNFSQMAVFQSNLYFLDKDNEEIIKYPALENFSWDSPQLWLAKGQKLTNAESLAVDGSVWVLNGNNTITRYYFGRPQETLNFDFFPKLKDISQISMPLFNYLYLLEPAQKRIIILDKSGKIIKQFQSDKFDNLLDFAVSEDEKTIWLLNGQKIYQIKN